MARRQSLLVAFCCLVCMLIGFAYIIIAEPLYTARASLSLNEPSGGELRSEAATVIDLDTNVELIRSDETTSAVIRELGLDEMPEFVPQPSKLRQIVDDLRATFELAPAESETSPDSLLPAMIRSVKSGLWVSRVGNTRVIDVRYTAYSQPLAVAIANAFARAHLDGVASRDGQSNQGRIERLELRAEAVRQTAMEADRKIQQILQKSGPFAAAPEELQGHTANLRATLSQLEAEDAALAMKLSLVNAYGENGDVAAFVVDTPESIRLLNDLNLAEQRLQNISSQPGASEDTVTLLETGLESLRANLDQEARLAAKAIQVQLDMNAAQKVNLTRQIADLRGYLASDTWAELEAARREKLFYDNLHQDYLTRLESAYREPQSRSDLRIVSEALPPFTPSSPNLKVILAIAATIGVFLGLGLAMVREWNRNGHPQS